MPKLLSFTYKISSLNAMMKYYMLSTGSTGSVFMLFFSDSDVNLQCYTIFTRKNAAALINSNRSRCGVNRWAAFIQVKIYHEQIPLWTAALIRGRR